MSFKKSFTILVISCFGLITNIQATLPMTQTESTPSTVPAETSGHPMLNIQHWQTSQGIPVYFVATPQLPMVDILVIFNAGSSRDNAKPGIAHLTNALLDEGTANLTADQISEQFDRVGVVYRTALDRDMAGVVLRSLTDPKFLEPALNTFTQVLTGPNFPEDAVQRLKNQSLTSLQQELQSPDAIAKKAFLKLLYGDQPYGHSLLGSEESVAAITRADVQQFYQQYYVGSNAQVVMVGDISAEKARDIANRVTQGLPPGTPASPLSAAKQITSAQQKTVNFPAQQTTVLLGQITIAPQDPDYFPLAVGNYILGSDPLVSELSKRIRSQHGWAYHVSSVFSPLQAGGPFAVFLQTRNEEAQNAINLAREIVSQFVQQGPTEQQLADAKKNIIGSFPLSLDSNADILDQLSYMVFYHLPLDYLDTYRAKVAAVTVNQVREAYQKHVRPGEMVTVTVGGLTEPATVTTGSGQT